MARSEDGAAGMAKRCSRGRSWEFLPDGSAASPKMARGAASAHPDENLEVNSNEHGRLGGLTPSARRCAGNRWTIVSAERNATIWRFNIASPSRGAALAKPQNWFSAPVEPRAPTWHAGKSAQGFFCFQSAQCRFHSLRKYCRDSR